MRSSATAEDHPDASFAGQQDTFLWVCGLPSVIEHTRRCWSSLFTDRAIAYRHQMGYLHVAIAMSVAVQKMVDPIASGVAFTLNPTNGDRSQVAIDASWGLGEAVVSGEVTPDNFLVDKVLREVVKREISTKLVEYRLTDHGVVEKLPIERERQNEPSVTDEHLIAYRDARPPSGEALRLSARRRVGDRPAPARRREHRHVAEPARNRLVAEDRPTRSPSTGATRWSRSCRPWSHRSTPRSERSAHERSEHNHRLPPGIPEGEEA